MSLSDNPHIVINKGQDDETIKAMPKTTQKMVAHGWSLQTKIDQLTEEIKALKKKLQDKYGTGVVLVMPSKCRAPISLSTTVSVGDSDLLKELTGDELATYATKQTSYNPTALYKEIILNPDHDQHELLTGTESIKKSTSVKFLPSK